MNTILQLSNGQKSLYDTIYKEICRDSYNIKLPLSFPKNSVNILVKLILGDHPELINIDNCCVYFSCAGLFNILKLQPVFKKSEYIKAKNLFDTEVNRILSSIIKPGTNIVQQTLAIHDYLVSNVAYDEAELHRTRSSVLSHTAYGAIVDKNAVCEGLSYAFSLLAHKAGIGATVVNGIVDGGEHSWNIVKLGSDFYHIDITGDLKEKSADSSKCYDYFCLNDNDIANRVWDKKIYPPCTSSRFSYFTVTKSYAHDESQMREIMLRQFSQYKKLYFKFDFINCDEDTAADYIWDVFQDVAHKNGLSVGPVTVSLSRGNSIFTLTQRN